MDSSENLLKLICTLLNVDQGFVNQKDWDAALAEIHSFRDRIANDVGAYVRERYAEIATSPEMSCNGAMESTKADWQYIDGWNAGLANFSAKLRAEKVTQ